MRRRMERSSRRLSVMTSRPSNSSSPAVGSSRRRIVRPVVDLPQPDSPTRPSVSPGAMSKLMPSTARTMVRSRANMLPLTSKYLASLRTLSRGCGDTSVIEETCRLVAGTHFLQGRGLFEMARLGEAAARRKAAAGAQFATKDRHGAGNLREPLLPADNAIDARNGSQQALRVGMQRFFEQRIDRRLFDDLARIHHDHALRRPGHDAEIVCDEQLGHAETILELAQEIEVFRLDRDIERGCRLVGNQELGVAGERPSDQ